MAVIGSAVIGSAVSAVIVGLIVLLTRNVGVRAVVHSVYVAIAEWEAIKTWHGFVQPLFGDREKYKLELLKIGIAAVVFLVSDNIMKLSFAGALSALAIYGVLPSQDHFLLSAFNQLEHEKLLIDDAIGLFGIVNHLLNHFLLFLVILLANLSYGLMLSLSFLLGLPLRLLMYLTSWALDALKTDTKKVYVDIPGGDPTQSTVIDFDVVTGDKSDDDDESTSLLTRMLRAVSLVENPPPASKKTSPPPLPDSADYLKELLIYEISRAKSNRFCYIRCLDPIDRETFQAKMIELIQENCKDRETQESIITQGGMRMSTWRRIMKQIQTFKTYNLWRRAYWGENAGRAEISPTRTKYHVLVEVYKGQGEIVNLLHSVGHIEKIPASLISPSSWSNNAESQRLWEDQCD